MAGRHVVARRDLYASKTASEVTSEVYWIGDAREITLFFRGSPSTTTVQISTDDGRTAALPENGWSNATVIISPGPDHIDVEPGPRWLRFLRSETTEATLNVRNMV